MIRNETKPGRNDPSSLKRVISVALPKTLDNGVHKTKHDQESAPLHCLHFVLTPETRQRSVELIIKDSKGEHSPETQSSSSNNSIFLTMETGQFGVLGIYLTVEAGEVTLKLITQNPSLIPQISELIPHIAEIIAGHGYDVFSTGVSSADLALARSEILKDSQASEIKTAVDIKA